MVDRVAGVCHGVTYPAIILQFLPSAHTRIGIILTTAQIEKNIAWLLSNGSAPVKYLTHKYLLKTRRSQLMKGLWEDVEICQDAQDILGKQEKDGSWYAGGSWSLKPSYIGKEGYDPFNPKYVTTVWVLPILGEMGFTVQDRRIRKACNYVLSHGYFLDPIFSAPTANLKADDVRFSPCRFSQYLVALGKVGLTDDVCVQKGYKVLVSLQRDDGGWALQQHIIERNWTRSCPVSSYHATLALYCSKNRRYKDRLTKALKFLVWHLSTKKDDELRRFFYHGHNTVHELLMFSEHQIGLEEKAIQTILEWLMMMYRAAEGCFKYIGKPISKYSNQEDGMDARVAKYRLYHVIEDDWLTYYMTRIGANLLDKQFAAQSPHTG